MHQHALQVAAPPQPWWSARPALFRFVADLVASEVAALRHDPHVLAHPWTETLSLEHDLALDSLEFMHVAGALSTALQMHHSGVEDYLLARRTLGDWVDIADLALRHHDSALMFSTSGSTGRPKHCAHALATLEQEAQLLAALFPGRRRVLAAVPAHHIYGFLFTQLLPRHLGLDTTRVVDARAHVPATLARQAAPGDLVVAHPAFWEAALAGGLEFPDDVVGVSSTAPCPDAVAQAAEASGLASLFQVYGSSETGGLGWRVSHRKDYRLLPCLKRDAANPRALVRTLPDGGQQTLEVQDVLAWHGERCFTVLARYDGAVQVGGLNVFPAQVREVLLAHPGVADCAVRLMRPDEGARLKAFIVRPAGDAGCERDFLSSLRAWIDAHLTVAERPKALTIGARLPRNALGKPADWNIA